MLKKLGLVIKNNWANILSLIFIWVIPIIMLNEYIALTETSPEFKITFMGCLVLLAIFLSLRKKTYAYINNKPHGVFRGVLLCLHKSISYGLLLGVLWAVNTFSGKLYKWWLLSGISILIGLVFLFVNEIIQRNIIKEKLNNGE